MRNFIIEDEREESDLKAQIRKEMLQKLASEWNQVHQKMERQSFRSEEDCNEEDSYHAERCGEACDEAEAEAEQKNPAITKAELSVVKKNAHDEYYESIHAQDRKELDRLAVIEELLGELGARMMRPYEHWNEEERHMEYLENRYDD